MTTKHQWLRDAAAALDAAVARADEVDRDLGTQTSIECEPGGFMVRMECRRKLAVGFGTHTVCRTTGHFALVSPTELVGTVNDAARQMLIDRDEYRRRRENGELTKL